MQALRVHSLCRSTRRLRVETLERRWLLDGAAWGGGIVHDSFGNVFAVDLLGDMAAELLGQTSEVMFDTAFSPSGQLYGVGGPAQGPSELYQIELNLDDPAKGIETTLVDVVSENNQGIFANGLEFGNDGTLFAAGYDVQGQGKVFSIDPLTGDAESEVLLGNYQSAGDLTFDTDGNMYVTTFSGDLLRVGPSLESFDVMGWAGAGDYYGMTSGPAPWMVAYRWLGDVYRINPPDAAFDWVVSLDHPSLSGVLGAATVFRPPTDLGPVDFLQLPDQQPTLGELWYRVEAAHDGYLTADLPGVAAESGIELTFYRQEPSGDLLTLASGMTRADYESAVTGQRYFLRVQGADAAVDVRVTNLVSPTLNGATVHGTDGNDSFEFDGAIVHDAVEGVDRCQLVINGVVYELTRPVSPPPVFDVTFNGGNGSDVAILLGSPQNDVATLWPGSAEAAGAQYVVEVTGTEEIAVEGKGGSDSATLLGSGGDDTANLWPGTAELVGTGYGLVAIDVPSILIDAGDGYDTQTFLGDSGETIEVWPDHAEFRGNSFLIQSQDFESTVALAGTGATLAILHDSSGNDTFTGQGGYGKLSGPSYLVETYDFATVQVDSLIGGVDVGRLYDSPGHDNFIAAPTFARLYGDGFSFELRWFEGVHAYATFGGIDEARLYDSPGDDTLHASPEAAALYGTGFYNRALHFEGVHAYSTAGGTDRAELYDSPDNDKFVATPVYGALFGDGFYNRAKFFDDVRAYATAGGIDEARMYDSDGNDLFVAAQGYGALSGDGYQCRAESFDGVHAFATSGGIDVARLYDSDGEDVLHAEPEQTAMFRPNGYYNRAKHFDGVHAYATAGGHDLARFYDSAGDDTFVADPEQSAMFQPGAFYNRAKFFEEVYADASASDTDRDEAFLSDSPSDDLLEAAGDTAQLFDAALDLLYEVGAFDYVKATAGQPGDQAVVDWPSLTFDLDLDGPW